MKSRVELAPSTPSATKWATALAAVAVATIGCHGNVDSGGGGGGGTTGTLCGAPATITGPGATVASGAPQRMLRLTLSQTTNAIGVLLGSSTAMSIATNFGVGDPTQTTFPALNGPREGVSVIPALFTKLDGIAAAGGQFVFDNFASVTGCTTVTDQCVQTFLLSFAEKAYRHPLNSTEQGSLMQVYTEVTNATTGAGGTPQEGAQYGVYAILSSPQFLYRTEFGDPSKKTADGVPLTPYEMASLLSFFLSDGPPDQPLLTAAKQNQLSTADQVGSQVDRMLALPAVQQNLTTAIFTYFKLNLLDNVVIDPSKVPQFTTGLQNAMYTEGQQFLQNTLWNGSINDLLTSRSTFVNADLATTVYNMAVPTGATTTNFVAAQAPDTRAGILTLPAFITSRARTDVGSVVARGLVVDETIMCQDIPGPPDNLSAQIAAARAMLPMETDKQAAEYRDTTSPCNGCHANFDPYGLVLDNYDVIARYRTVDEMGRPLDTTTPLPPALGSGTVANAVDMATQLAANGAFTTCLTKSMIQYSLTDVTSAPVDLSSCAVQTVNSQVNASKDKNFATLVRDIATSKMLAYRTQGGN
jgi:hypothetical protein